MEQLVRAEFLNVIFRITRHVVVYCYAIKDHCDNNMLKAQYRHNMKRVDTEALP